jgi:hypothetical protein
MSLPPGTVGCRTDWKSVLRRCGAAPQMKGLNSMVKSLMWAQKVIRAV